MPQFKTIIAGILFTLAAVISFYPILPEFSSSLIGPVEDNQQFVWFLWYGAKAMVSPDWQVMHSKMIYYPEGMNLSYANYFYFGFFVYFLIQKLVSLAAAFNLLILLSFILSGIGMYRFLRWLHIDPWICMLAGYVFAFNPSHHAHADHHITIASIQFIPFFAHYLLKSISGYKRADAIRAGVFGSLMALCDWNYLVYGLLFAGLVFICKMVSSDKTGRIKTLKISFVAAVVVGVPLLPLIIPMVYLGVTHKGGVQYLPGSDTYVADLMGFFIPHYQHLAGGISRIRELNSMMTGNRWESAVYLGIINFIIIAVFYRVTVKRYLFFWIGFVFFAITAMGVNLHVLGRVFDCWMPYDALEALPFLKHARNPSRAIVWCYFFLAALVAFSIQYFSDEFPLRKKLLYAVCVLIILDFTVIHHDKTVHALPRSYDVILDAKKKSKESFAILEIPWDKGRYMAYQTLHEIPIVQGYLGRKFGVPLAARIPYEGRQLPIQKIILAKHKVKYVIVNRKMADHDTGKLEDMAKYLQLSRLVKQYEAVYPKVFEDENTAVFKVY